MHRCNLADRYVGGVSASKNVSAVIPSPNNEEISPPPKRELHRRRVLLERSRARENHRDEVHRRTAWTLRAMTGRSAAEAGISLECGFHVFVKRITKQGRNVALM